MMGYLLMKKRENHQQRKNWSDKYFCCITRCHSLSLVVIRYQALVVPLLSLDLPLVCLFIDNPFFTVLSSSNLPNFVYSFIFDGLTSKVTDVSAVFL